MTVALLLNGNMCDSRMWSAHGTCLHAPFTRRGMAIACPELAAPTIEGMARAALGVSTQPLLLVGFSMGAIVAAEILRQVPERVIGTVLLSCNIGPDLPERSRIRPRQQQAVRAGRLLEVVREELKPHYLARRHAADRRLLRLLEDMAVALGPQVFVAQSEALRTRGDYVGSLADWRGPTLLAVGAEDRLCPPERHRQFAASLANAECHIIEGAGHMLPLEETRALAAVFEGWFERNPELPQ